MWKDLVNFVLVILFLLQIRGGGCLQLIGITVPPYKMRGSLAVLQCEFHLGDDHLYAVKWYKDNEEFYRYVPRATPKQTAYDVEGVKVSVDLSTETSVTLKSVTLKSSGLYKCEVSCEAPSFVSASAEAKMEVIYFPSAGPYIAGANRNLNYHVGDELRVNCTSPKSHPPPNLDWYINDVKVPEIGGSLQRHEPKVMAHNLRVSQVTLMLRILSHYFKGGHMKLKCVSSLPSSYFQSDKNSDGQNVAPLLEQREATLIIKADGSNLSCSLTLILLPVLLSVARA